MQVTKKIPAGIIKSDANIEFVGNADDKSVIFLQNGSSNQFSELPDDIFLQIQEKYNTDIKAQEILEYHYPDASAYRRIELYTYYMYGALDNVPDVIDGVLQGAENFRDKIHCLSLDFQEKNIDHEGVVLKKNQIYILDMIADGLPDKAIAANLNIAVSTLDFHKRNLFRIFNVDNKSSLLLHAMKSNIILL